MVDWVAQRAGFTYELHPPSGNGTYNGTIVTGHGRKGGNVFGNSWIPGTTLMHFRGQSILRESIKKLAALGKRFYLAVSVARDNGRTRTR